MEGLTEFSGEILRGMGAGAPICNCWHKGSQPFFECSLQPQLHLMLSVSQTSCKTVIVKQSIRTVLLGSFRHHWLGVKLQSRVGLGCYSLYVVAIIIISIGLSKVHVLPLGSAMVLKLC